MSIWTPSLARAGLRGFSSPRAATARRLSTTRPRRSEEGDDRLTHVDASGEARMVDVGHKRPTRRRAVARAHVETTARAIELVRTQAVAKGDVFAVARVAGIMAAKRTAGLLPLCHPVALSAVSVHLSLDAGRRRVEVEATAETVGPTGVEMEALVACSTAALTVYDMLKAVDKGMVVGGLRVVSKEGGKSGDWRAP